MDRLVLFYVGQFRSDADAEGKDLGFLVPSDAQINNVAKSITFDQLKDFTDAWRRSTPCSFLILRSVAGSHAPQQLSLEAVVTGGRYGAACDAGDYCRG